MTTTQYKIAFLGLGAMGSRMVLHLLAAGHHVTVWNRSNAAAEALKEKGAVVANSPAEAVKNVNYVISMVRDDEASRYVWSDPSNGVLSSMPQDAIAIESSTLSLKWTQTLSKLCQESGISFVDAPVAGSRPQAEQAKLIYFVGASNENFNKVSNLLSLMGAQINHCGSESAGMQLKLIVNAFFGMQLAALAELLGVLKRSDLNMAKVFEILSNTPVCSMAAKLSGNAMINAQYAAAFPIKLVEKDLDYVNRFASSLEAEIPLGHTTQAIFKAAVSNGYAEDNITGVAQLYLNN